MIQHSADSTLYDIQFLLHVFHSLGFIVIMAKKIIVFVMNFYTGLMKFLELVSCL